MSVSTKHPETHILKVMSLAIVARLGAFSWHNIISLKDTSKQCFHFIGST